MKASEILEALGKDKELFATVWNALGYGMLDEWDCTIEGALKHGHGELEFAVAARTGAIVAKHWEEQDG